MVPFQIRRLSGFLFPFCVRPGVNFQETSYKSLHSHSAPRWPVLDKLSHMRKTPVGVPFGALAMAPFSLGVSNPFLNYLIPKANLLKSPSHLLPSSQANCATKAEASPSPVYLECKPYSSQQCQIKGRKGREIKALNCT